MHFYDFQRVGEKLKGILLDSSDVAGEGLGGISIIFPRLSVGVAKKLMKFKMEFYIFSLARFIRELDSPQFSSHCDRANQFSKHIFRWNYLSSFWSNLESRWNGNALNREKQLKLLSLKTTKRRPQGLICQWTTATNSLTRKCHSQIARAINGTDRFPNPRMNCEKLLQNAEGKQFFSLSLAIRTFSSLQRQ